MKITSYSKDVAKMRVALDFIDWLDARELLDGTTLCVYVNDKRITNESCYANADSRETTYKGKKFWINSDYKGSDYVEYANDDLITVTFEGDLNYLLNYGTSLDDKLNQFWHKYGLYHEYGYSWSFSTYEC